LIGKLPRINQTHKMTMAS